MQVSPSAALFQALSSISQPQGAQFRGDDQAEFARQVRAAAEAETPQAVSETRRADAAAPAAERPVEPSGEDGLRRGSLVDISA